MDANKKQNRISDYRQAIKELHKHGISVMAGLISGFDQDTYNSTTKMSDDSMSIGLDVPFLSIMTPFIGKDIYTKHDIEKRILKNHG